MDKSDYAIIGWVDEGQPADFAALAKMLGLGLMATLNRLAILRAQGKITHAWLELCRADRRRLYWRNLLANRRN